MLTLRDYSDGQKNRNKKIRVLLLFLFGVSLLLYILLIFNFSAYKMVHVKEPPFGT